MTFGEKIKSIRLSKKISIRKLCKIADISTSYYSKIEREIQNPYSKEDFIKIIKALDITDSKIINELELLAIKEIPFKKELSEDEYKELIKKHGLKMAELEKFLIETDLPDKF